LVNHKSIARQGININRNTNEGEQVSPSGDQPFFEELIYDLHRIPFIPYRESGIRRNLSIDIYALTGKNEYISLELRSLNTGFEHQ
jgi:hypothetical protein